MNDDYDKHIIQKYRLAVAIAIINNTPENSTPNKYLEELRNNIIPEMESYDPDMTICEDDFYDDDIEVMNDLNANNETQLFDSQTNDSITILKDFNFDDMMQNINDSDIRDNNSVSDVLKILKAVGNAETEVSCSNDGNVLNHSQSTYCENSQNLLHEPNLPLNKYIGQTQAFNSEIFSIPGVQNKSSNEINVPSNRKANLNPTERAMLNDSQEINTYQEYTDNFTHVSQSQDNIVLPKYFIQNDKSNLNKTILPEVQKILNVDRSKEIKSILNNNKVQIFFNSDESKTLGNNISENKKIKQTHGNNDVIIINDMMVENDTKKHKLASQDKIDNTQAKRNRNVDNDIAPDTDTAYFNEIKNKFNINDIESNSGIMMNSSVKKPNEHFGNLNKPNDVTNSFQSLNQIIDRDSNIKIVSDNDNFKRNSLDNFGSHTSNESNKANKIAYSSQTFSQFSQEFDSEPNNTKVIEIASNSIDQNTEAKEESEEEQIIEDLFNELTDSQAEVVPFKVLEELSKVKAFLNKQKRVSSECASDSGYKSDTQSRNSLKRALQSSNIWMNQSAHCLLTYISQCPLVVNTEDIANEISKALGRLIDRLHEEEKYPSFLEQLLQTVDTLLKEIYEEDSDGKFLQKDDNICRLFLLNKSSHIMKYTTEKIISILEELNTILTSEELLEASRTIQTENLSYIFHILEILIKKLVVHKSLSQKSTQNSQEDEIVLKRSSIADIWRKKWNPDKKCVLGSSGGVKECVLVRCGEVLNKLIVQAMDGYSLISYFALQCFNLLQK